MHRTKFNISGGDIWTVVLPLLRNGGDLDVYVRSSWCLKFVGCTSKKNHPSNVSPLLSLSQKPSSIPRLSKRTHPSDHFSISKHQYSGSKMGFADLAADAGLTGMFFPPPQY